MIKQDKPSDRIQTRKETKSRRSSMVIKVLSFNIQKNKLSKDKKFIKKWESLSDASRDLNINAGNISKCLKGKTRSCGGFTWEYEKSDFGNKAHSVKPEAHSPLGKG